MGDEIPWVNIPVVIVTFSEDEPPIIPAEVGGGENGK